ncbi:MAG: hypothetical protein VB032_07690 [Burkholderiaceae bacterium]|nr:hypothetical protein [Burkholderiaceae bacterium]
MTPISTRFLTGMLKNIALWPRFPWLFKNTAGGIFLPAKTGMTAFPAGALAARRLAHASTP